MVKKCMNKPELFVDDSLNGIYLAHAGFYESAGGDHRALIHRSTSKRRVGIVTGGGYGHLPVFLGYVGDGLCDGCAVGNEGDKTILDALCPFARELSSAYASGKTLNDALYCAVEAADAGVEATKGRVAKTGRAKWLAERNMEYPDGGAYLCARVVRKLLH